MTEDANDESYAAQLGERMRAIRQQKGLSLNEVEQSTNQEFKASVMGAYERGEHHLRAATRTLGPLLQRHHRPDVAS